MMPFRSDVRFSRPVYRRKSVRFELRPPPSQREPPSGLDPSGSRYAPHNVHWTFHSASPCINHPRNVGELATWASHKMHTYRVHRVLVMTPSDHSHCVRRTPPERCATERVSRAPTPGLMSHLNGASSYNATRCFIKLRLIHAYAVCEEPHLV